MYFEHIYEKGLAQASYFIGCQSAGEAVVIDPKRDIDVYLKIAERENMTIKKIAETHIHADFLSGSRELQAATGAEIYVSDEGGEDWQYQFPHNGLKDGDKFKAGNLTFEVMHTPGHTPEHISFLLTDGAASSEPVMIFTGDFVFVGDIGRPDLLEKAAGISGTMEKGARDMFKSVKKFKQLPDYIQVWPAHGAGSACGKSLGAVPNSTVGYEKLTNWAMKIEDEEEFVKQLLDGQPEPPKYFAMMKKLNKEGADVLGGIPHPARLTLNKFDEVLHKNILIVDTRDKLSFAGGHVPGSLNIQDNSAFSTWAGWMIKYDEPFLLIASDHNIEELTKKLIRIGLDNIYGYFADIDKWSNRGNELETAKQITCNGLSEKLENNEVYVLDVRGSKEFNEGHIKDALHIHTGDLEKELDKIPTDKDVVVHCASGDRSSIAVSYLMKKGFDNVINLTGGYSSWINDCGKKHAEDTVAEEVEISV